MLGEDLHEDIILFKQGLVIAPAPGARRRVINAGPPHQLSCHAFSSAAGELAALEVEGEHLVLCGLGSFHSAKHVQLQRYRSGTKTQ